MFRLQHNSTRAYVIMDITEGAAEDAYSVLASKSGVQSIDLVNNPLRLVVVMSGSDRAALQKGTLEAISSVQEWTRNVQCLPVIGLN